MKFGVREICDVVLRAKSAMKVGNKVFYKNEPVIYFDSLKTSSMEGQATTVYAQGGRGNARLIAWEGERTVTFTMEDALISPAGFSILTGAGLVQASNKKPIIIHKTETTTITKLNQSGTGDNVKIDSFEIELTDIPYFGKENFEKTIDENNEETNNSVVNDQDFVYVMLLDENGEIKSEPYIASETETLNSKTIKIYAEDSQNSDENTLFRGSTTSTVNNRKNDIKDIKKGDVVLVDYYVAKTGGAFEIDITPDKFGGNFYLEASTLFRATNGVDMPAEFIIPNCKIQSNFTFTMASSGDPSTFTFTMDAFPDYTRWNKTEKVFASIQVIEDSDTLADLERLGTNHDYGKKSTAPHDEPYATYLTKQKPDIDPKGEE